MKMFAEIAVTGVFTGRQDCNVLSAFEVVWVNNIENTSKISSFLSSTYHFGTVEMPRTGQKREIKTIFSWTTFQVMIWLLMTW